MSLRDELYQISEEALKQQEQEKRERYEKVSEYLTEKLKEAAAYGEKSCDIKLKVLVAEDIYLLSKDVSYFAAENDIDCVYPKIINATSVKLCWDKK